jgi:hypothetical protein
MNRTQMINLNMALKYHKYCYYFQDEFTAPDVNDAEYDAMERLLEDALEANPKVYNEFKGKDAFWATDFVGTLITGDGGQLIQYIKHNVKLRHADYV